MNKKAVLLPPNPITGKMTMAKFEPGDIAQFRAISRRLKLYELNPEEIDENVKGMLEGMFGCAVGGELFELLKMASDNDFIEYISENAMESVMKGNW
ncbi:calcium-binding hemolysin protein [Klebsiella phage vB_KqM-Bilbo]|nr:calcium-binding hemolysin protein [Klebsiella phage vB_KqM-Bilbo]CAD5240406.1 calcium-binding hemolysin protein [Klebsiella phage vB_KqM-LilBean]